MQNESESNKAVIQCVVITVCLCAIVGVGVEAFCVVYKVPDMNTQLAGGFTHVVDTIIGALIAMLINTKSQVASTPGPTPVNVTNTAETPVQTHEANT